MKLLVAALVLVLFAAPAFADTWVKGHYSDGRWVPGYWRSDANDTKEDNWSTQGNYNPRTGKVGGEEPEDEREPEPYRQNTTTTPDQSSRDGSTVTIPRLDAPIGSTNRDCKRRTIYEPRCD